MGACCKMCSPSFYMTSTLKWDKLVRSRAYFVIVSKLALVKVSEVAG